MKKFTCVLLGLVILPFIPPLSFATNPLSDTESGIDSQLQTTPQPVNQMVTASEEHVLPDGTIQTDVYSQDTGNLSQTLIKDSQGNTISKTTYLPDGNVNTITDNYGIVTKATYDNGIRQDTIFDSNGVVVGYNNYDASSKIINSTNANGNITSTMQYDDQNRLISVTENNNGLVNITKYDTQGRIAAIEVYPTYDDQNKITSADNSNQQTDQGRVAAIQAYPTYDDQSKIASADNSNQQTNQGRIAAIEEYSNSDDQGRIAALQAYPNNDDQSKIANVNSANEQTTTNQFGDKTTTIDGQISKIEHVQPDGSILTKNFNDGVLASTLITDANGATTVTTYQPDGKVSTITDVYGNVTKATYDNGVRKDTIYNSNGVAVAYNYYNESGLMIKSMDFAGNITSTMQYDDQNRLVSVTNYLDPYKGTETYTGWVSIAHYDAQGKYTYTETKDCSVQQTTTDQYGNKTYTNDNGQITKVEHLSPDGNYVTTNYTYGSGGKLTQTVTKDSAGNVITQTTFTYKRSMLVSSSEMDAEGGITVTTYQSDGKVSTITDKNGSVTKASYHNGIRTDTIMDNQGSVVGHNYYNESGLMVKSMDMARNTTATMQYDDQNQLVSVTNYLDPCKDTANYYGRVSISHYINGDWICSEEKPIGQPPTTDQYGNTTYYHANGQISKLEHLTFDNKIVTTNYTYDTAGNLTQAIKTNSEGNIISQTTYKYNGNTLVSASTTDELGGITVTTFNPDGKENTTTDKNGYVTKASYDNGIRTDTITDMQGAVVGYNYYNKQGLIVESMDNSGNITSTVQYDGQNRLVSVTNYLDPCKSLTDPYYGMVSISHIVNGDLVSTEEISYSQTPTHFNPYDPGMDGTKWTTDQYGNKTYTNDYGQITKVEHLSPDGKYVTTNFTYDSAGNLTQAIKNNSEGNIISQTTYKYNGNTLVSASTSDELGGMSVTTFNPNGTENTTTDKNGYVTKTSYDNGIRTDTIMDNQGAVVGYNYYNEQGLIVKSMDNSGNITSTVQYDDQNRLLTVTNYLDPCKDTESYSGRVIISHYVNGDFSYSEEQMIGDQTVTTDQYGNKTYYNTKGQIIKVEHPLADGSIQTISYSYDKAGNLSQTINKDAAGNIFNKVTYKYNGNTLESTSTTDADGHTSVATFLPDGTLSTQTNPDGIVTKVTYENGIRLDSVYDSQGVLIYHNDYNALGQIINTKDANGNIKMMIKYDDQNRMLTETDFDGSNQATDGYSGSATITHFDTNGNVTFTEQKSISVPQPTTNLYGDKTYYTDEELISKIEHTCADGTLQTTYYDYDTADRLSQTVIKDAAGNVISQTTYKYNVTILVSASTKDDKGSTTVTAYQPNGKVSTITDVYGNVTKASYNNGVRQDTIYNSNGVAVAYNYYDASGLIIKSMDFAGNIISTMQYDEHSRLVTVTNYLDPNKGTGTYNGMVSISHFDAHDNFIYSEEKMMGDRKPTTNQYMDKTYYNTEGNITKVEHFNLDGWLQTTTYNYDTAGRLSQTVTKDHLGNIVSQTAYTYNGGVLDSTLTTDTAGGSVTTHYTLDGKVSRIENSNGTVTEVSYTDGIRKDTVTNGGSWIVFGNNISYNNYNALGQIINSTDQNGSITMEAHYDDQNRLVMIMNYPDPHSKEGAIGIVTITYFDSHANVAYSEQKLMKSNQQPTTDQYGNKTYYDAKGQISKVEHNLTDGSIQTTSYVYDTADRLSQTITKDAAGKVTSKTAYTYYGGVLDSTLTTDSAGGSVTTHYTLDGKLRNIENANGSMVEVSYANGIRKDTIYQDRFTVTGYNNYDAGGRFVNSTDVDGKITSEASYDDHYRLVTVTNYLNPHKGTGNYFGTEIINHYDAYGNFTSSEEKTIGQPPTTDQYGNTTYYDPQGKISKVEHTLGDGSIQTTTYNYDNAGKLTQTITKDAEGILSNQTDYTYKEGVLESSLSTDHFGIYTRQTTTTYQPDGKISSIQGPYGLIATVAYTNGIRQDTLTDYSGILMGFNNYDASGKLINTKDANGNITSTMQYDDQGALISKTVYYDTYSGNGIYHGPAEISLCDAHGNFIRTDYFKEIGNTDATDKYGNNNYYNDKGQITKVEHTLKDNSIQTTIYSYDSAGRLTKTETRGPQGEFVSKTDYTYNGGILASTLTTDGVNGKTTTTYLPTDGKVTTITDAHGNVTNASYANGIRQDTIYDPNGIVTGYNNYDGSGNIINTQDRDGNTTSTMQYDENGALMSVICYLDPYKGSGTYHGQVQIYHYDIHGNFNFSEEKTLDISEPSIDNYGNKTYYNMSGQISKVEHTRFDGTIQTTSYYYDRDGKLTKTEAYDAQGNFVERIVYTYNAGILASSLTTEANNDTAATTYLPNGKVSTITDNYGNITKATYTGGVRQDTIYDSKGNLTGYNNYDASGKIINTKNAMGIITNIMQYDDQGRLVSITEYRDALYGFFPRPGDYPFAETGDYSGWARVYHYDVHGNETDLYDWKLIDTRPALDQNGNRTYYNEKGQITMVVHQLSDSHGLNVYYEIAKNNYASDGKLMETVTKESLRDLIVSRTVYSYDGNVLTSSLTTFANNATTATTYLPDGRINTITATDSLGNISITRASYNNGIRMDTMYDVNGTLRGYKNYNSLGLFINTKDANGNYTSIAQYDDQNRLVTVTRYSPPFSGIGTYHGTEYIDHYSFGNLTGTDRLYFR